MSKKKAASVPSSKPKKKRVNGLAKGKNFERDLAVNIRHIFPEAERMLEYQASKVIGVDLEGTDVFKFQCKNHANYVSIKHIGEIKLQHEDEIPVLVTKGIRMEAMAVMPLRKLVTLLEVVYGLSPQWKVPEEEIKKAIDFIHEKVTEEITEAQYRVIAERAEEFLEIEEEKEDDKGLSIFI